MEEQLKILIQEWRDQSQYSTAIGDIAASRVWDEAADQLEEVINS